MNVISLPSDHPDEIEGGGLPMKTAGTARPLARHPLQSDLVVWRVLCSDIFRYVYSRGVERPIRMFLVVAVLLTGYACFCR